MRIRPAQADELDLYIDFLAEIAEWVEGRGVGHVSASVYRDRKEFFSYSIARGEVYFGLIGDDVVGSLRLVAEDPIIWPQAGPDALYIHNLMVRRACSGRGLGHELLAWAEQQTVTAGKTWLRLDCFASNSFLRAYYESAGFSDRGEIEAHYPFGTLRLQRYEKRM